jgi:two-component system sensor histidine kinase PfeS
MNHRLLWKLCFIIASGSVALFYGVDWAVEKAEQSMSTLSKADKHQLTLWADQAERIYGQDDKGKMNTWLDKLAARENTWVSVAQADIQLYAGNALEDNNLKGYNMGRSIDWEVHLFFAKSPVMELPFEHSNLSFLIQLPERMRPGSYWQTTRVVIQVIMPLLILSLVSFILYRHIMHPLKQLKQATTELSLGNFQVRVHQNLGSRDDEIAELAKTFDDMAERIGELIFSQRQLIADLSHELRTPLSRLDIAIDSLDDNCLSDQREQQLRLQRESRQIRKLVEDALTFAWLDNERPKLNQEDLDLIDLIDVLIDDARYEFPDRNIITELPPSAPLRKTCHKALGQAIENVLRNAMRYTPIGQSVNIRLLQEPTHYQLLIIDQGPGVPEELLETIFKPFYRVEKSRQSAASQSGADPVQQSFGLGLALAQRQIQAIGGQIKASNCKPCGLQMTIELNNA